MQYGVNELVALLRREDGWWLIWRRATGVRDAAFELASKETFVNFENPTGHGVGNGWGRLHSEDATCTKTLVAFVLGVHELLVHCQGMDNVYFNVMADSMAIDDARRWKSVTL
jgi:hypothetical protein